MPTPELHGLVLSGGQSSRMGRDKGSIIYGELGRTDDQRSFCASLLRGVCNQVFISLRAEQSVRLAPAQAAIFDEAFLSVSGPGAALISAHHRFPRAAWLILACDFPLADAPTLSLLTKERDSAAFATAFEKDGFIEPFFTIWEPRALAGFERSGYASPQRFLGLSNIRKILTHSRALTNCNSTSDEKRINLNKSSF